MQPTRDPDPSPAIQHFPRRLVGKNRISARRADVLAHISSLLLRTLPAITAEQLAGITYIPNPPESDTT